MRSDTLIILLFVAAVFVLVVGSALWTAYRRRRRARQMSEAALEMGFSFDPDGQALLDEGIGKVPLFCLASIRRGTIVNLLRGRSGSSAVAVCDCWYTTSTRGSAQSAREQTAFCFEVKGLDLPDFSLAPRGSPAERQMVSSGLALGAAPAATSSMIEVLAAALRAAADKGIEFPDHPEFSSEYYLWVEDSEKVRSVFLEHAVDFFARQEKPLVSVQKAGNWLVVFRKNKLVPAESLAQALAEAVSVRALFPSPW